MTLLTEEGGGSICQENAGEVFFRRGLHAGAIQCFGIKSQQRVTAWAGDACGVLLG